jgi:hypothetical protein
LSNGSFKGIQIFSGNARTSGAGIKVWYYSDLIIDDFSMNNMVVGILIETKTGDTASASLKVIISNGTINNILVTTGIGIRVHNGLGGDTYIGPNIVMSNPPASKPSAGIQLEATGHCSIFRVNVTSCDYGLYIVPSTSEDVTYLFVDHSLFDSCGTAGMYINASTATSRVRNLMSVNSWYSGSTSNPGYGIWIAGAGSSTIDSLSFIGARILNNYTHGVYWTYAATDNVSFTDCTISGNSAGSSGAADGINIAANCTNFGIFNSKIGQAGTASNTQRYAINIAAGTSGDFQIIGNDLQPNVTAPYLNYGALTGPGQLIHSNYFGVPSATNPLMTNPLPTQNMFTAGEALSGTIAGPVAVCVWSGTLRVARSSVSGCFPAVGVVQSGVWASGAYVPFLQMGLLTISVSGQQNKRLILGSSGDVVVLSGGPCSGGLLSGVYQRLGMVISSGVGLINVDQYCWSGLPANLMRGAIFL